MRAFVERGIDPERDFAKLTFMGFPQDRIVEAVLAGEADLGIVRSGLLERMEAEGAVREGALRVLNANVTYTYPDAVSTRLYPEWPFLATAGVAQELRDRVALALLSAGREVPELAVQWSAPVSYRDARRLAAAYAAHQAADGDRAGRGWVVAAAAGAALLALALLWRGWHSRRREPAGAATPAPPRPAEDPRAGLTRRERQVLDRIAEGGSTKEIAQALGISPKTVEFHRSNLLKKFDARNSAQLVASLQARGAAPKASSAS